MSRVDKDIGRFDIAMYNAQGMQLTECSAHLLEKTPRRAASPRELRTAIVHPEHNAIVRDTDAIEARHPSYATRQPEYAGLVECHRAVLIGNALQGVTFAIQVHFPEPTDTEHGIDLAPRL